VLDNLNTHFEGSLIETFGKRKATRLQKKIKFIYTPKHASWLNMAEIEINIMDRQCTGGRMKVRKNWYQTYMFGQSTGTETGKVLNGNSPGKMQIKNYQSTTLHN
jgi:hypothetical protein